MKVWQRLQRIESLAEQISAAQSANGPAPEGTNLPLNALKHSLNRAARTGDSNFYWLLHASVGCCVSAAWHRTENTWSGPASFM